MCELAREVIILQCITVSKHQVVRFKYAQFSFVNYTSRKLEKRTKKKRKCFKTLKESRPYP